MKKFQLGRFLIGRRLATEDLAHQAISKPIGLAVFASDALSSTAYATEEILIILALAAGAGTAVFTNSIPIAIAISVLLVIVTISYRQTIYAYPRGGGAYIVARENLGESYAQVAGAALLTDYILTVAVSISAGVAQITSAFHDLFPYRVHIAVLVIILITIINLRGVKESGNFFAVPTYFFLILMFLTLGVGFFQAITGNLDTISPDSVEEIHHGTQTLTLFLILRAFSSGCTALTGIEAISNGITAFKEPRSHNAATTLVAMSTILITLFLGITILSHQIEVIPSHNETVISQMGRAIYGDTSIMHLLVLGATALILLMAANTSYADFPRLAALQAADGFLPRQLTYRGGRLVFSWGIIALAMLASMLVIFFDAQTTRLIPLYAVGVFLSFTLSQTGMVIRARRIGKLKPGEVVKGLETDLEYDEHWKKHMIISAVGAVSTAIVMMVFAVTKFWSGAWFIVILIPTLVFIFFRIHSHYKEVAVRLSRENVEPVKQYKIQTLLLVDNVHAQTVRLVNFAKALDNPWTAVHIGLNPERVEQVKQRWQERIGEGTLEIIDSPYRQLAGPLKEYVEDILEKNPDTFVHIIMGHLQMDTYWEQALHQNSAYIFNLALSRLDRVIVTQVPYQIHHDEDEEEDAQPKPSQEVKMDVPPSPNTPVQPANPE